MDFTKTATQTSDLINWFVFNKVPTDIFRWDSGHHIQERKRFLVECLRFFSFCENLRKKKLCILLGISQSPRKYQFSPLKTAVFFENCLLYVMEYSTTLHHYNTVVGMTRIQFLQTNWFMCSKTACKNRTVRHWRWDFTLFRKWHYIESWIHLSLHEIMLVA